MAGGKSFNFDAANRFASFTKLGVPLGTKRFYLSAKPVIARRAYNNLMRLNTDQIQAICQAATDAFGQGTSVWLFGSRVDDSKRGGDIDLLVRPHVRTAADAAEPQQAFMQKIKMLNLLENSLGERKIDLVVEQAQDPRPIVEVAHKKGIKLQ